MPLYKAVTSTNAMSSRTAKISEPVSAFESRNSAKLRDIKIMQWNWVRETKTWTYSPNQNWMYDASFVSLLI